MTSGTSASAILLQHDQWKYISVAGRCFVKPPQSSLGQIDACERPNETTEQEDAKFTAFDTQSTYLVLLLYIYMYQMARGPWSACCAVLLLLWGSAHAKVRRSLGMLSICFYFMIL
jgi:hypothetical protein